MESHLTGQDMAFDPATDVDGESIYQSSAHCLEGRRYGPVRQLEEAG